MKTNSTSGSRKALAILNGTLVLPDRLLPDGVILIQDGRLSAVGERSTVRVPRGVERVDAGGAYVTPGFIDIHCHGGDGADFMDGTAAAVRAACRAHARHGTTTIFPTTTTGAPGQISRMIQACGSVARARRGADGARVAGVHLYGPYFAPDKVGCHSRQGCRDPRKQEYLKHFRSGMIRVATCAAELPGAEEFYRFASGQGCLVTCGHSNASWSEMDRAFRAGMRHVDHFWCAMSSVGSLRERCGTPMQGSMEQYVLMNREMSTEVIADGFHLAPELLEFAFRMLGPERLCLVTDSNRALDMPPGRYRFGPKTDGSWFESDGNVGFQPGAGLASGIQGMDTMVRNMIERTSAGVVNAVRMASLTPAQRVGIADETGSLEIGKRADVLMLSPDFSVLRVLIGGESFR